MIETNVKKYAQKMDRNMDMVKHEYTNIHRRKKNDGEEGKAGEREKILVRLNTNQKQMLT